ncbi:MAG: AarF/ABC1/UbiB kinase family protein [Alphaproteobacteria bacterium]|nr:AarF/ABC1/UbiB kinase family protein [Alphaproteobacteria bacterium]
MSSSDSSRLSGRVKRYAQVGRAVGGLALGAREDRAQKLKEALGGLKGPLMKVAQIMATIPDALPADYAASLRELQSNAPRMGWPFVKRRMVGELGPDWQARFQDFEIEAAHAASLGQVHRATAHDGRALACKLQYPGMDSVVAADLKQLKLIFALYKAYDGAIDPKEIHAELSERLTEELDYRREAANMRLYADMLKDEAGVQVPESLPELSTDRLLTMTWLQGRPLLELKDSPQEMRDQVALNMFRAWYVPFYRFGVIHGDPHLGNYTLKPDGSVNLLDFGCIRVFPPRFVKGVLDLYKAVETGDRDLAVSAYESWGFAKPSAQLVETLNHWASFLFAPLLEDRPRLIQETVSPGAEGYRVVAKVQEELRRMGGVRPPREFVLMDRAAIGLGSVFLHLRARINWHRLFHTVVGDFSLEELGKQQNTALLSAGVAPAKKD